MTNSCVFLKSPQFSMNMEQYLILSVRLLPQADWWCHESSLTEYNL